MNLNNLDEALNVIYNQLNQYEFVQIEGTGYKANKSIVLILSIYFTKSKIRIDIDNKSRTTISSITLNELGVVESYLKRIFNEYKIKVRTVAFIRSIKFHEITLYSYEDGNLSYSLLSNLIGENEMSLSYTIVNQTINDLEFIKNYNYFNRILIENTDFKIIRPNPHPIKFFRMRKLNEIGIL